jgi:phenylacetate-CoA ligase
VQKQNGADEVSLSDELQERFVAETEIHPNKILFHTAPELRRMQGVGTQLKEQKIVDHRPDAMQAAGGKS